MANRSKNIVPKSLTRKELKWRLGGIVVLVIVCLAAVFPGVVNKGVNWLNTKAGLGLPSLPNKEFSLGLDLQGGAHLIYRANTDQITGDKTEAVEGVRDIIENRLRGGLSVKEPIVQTTRVGADYRIMVELPGIASTTEAIEKIGQLPILEFKEQNNTPQRDLTPAEKKSLDAFNAAANKKAREALVAVRGGLDFAGAVNKYSEDEKSKVNGGDLGFITKDIYPEIYDWAGKQKVGAVSTELVKSFDGLNVVKKIAEKDAAKKIVSSHILVCYVGATNCPAEYSYTKAEAKQKVEDLKKQATAANFAELAKTNSTEPGADTSGGELPVFGQGQMIEKFEKAIWDVPSGSIIGPVETEYGFHLIYKKGEQVDKTYQVARIYVKIKDKTEIVPPVDEWKVTGLSGKQLKRAEVATNQNTGEVQVSLEFDAEGAKMFGEITGRNVGKPVAIFVDGKPVSIPRVNEAITTGSAVITGNFTAIEARDLSKRLNSGALPVPVELLSQEQVGSTLGADSLSRSLTAGLAGLILVMLFMVFYYRLPGLLSVLTLSFYAILSLAIFKIFGVTLTLAGIAGLILSIGMAVDANVLVFERLKEELQFGKSLKTAMEESFVRAWPSIWDSHITTLISCVLLVEVGSGFIKGFGVVLAIGLIINLFTAYSVTRSIMRFVLPWFNENGNALFLGYKKKEENNLPTK